MYFKENAPINRNDKNDDEEKFSQNVDPTTPMCRRQNPSPPPLGRVKGIDTSYTEISRDLDTNNGHDHLNNGQKCKPAHNDRFHGKFRKRSNNTCIDDDDDDDDDDEDDDNDDVELCLPFVHSTFSGFSNLTQNLPLFLTKKRKKRGEKVKQKSKTKLSRGQKIEAILVGVTAFLANAIIMSFVASLAIYNVEFKNYFVKNHEWITFIVIFPTGVFGVVGLLTGIFINKFGVRITGVTGSILLTVGVGACFFARDVFYLLPFLGIFGGTGCSLVYLTISMSMCDYFKNKGRLLMPLITVSEGVGTIISPLLTNYLIDVYGWRGSILLMSGIMFQLTACVFMYSIKKMQPQNGDRKQTGIRSADPSNNEFGHFRFLPDSSLQRRTNVPASLQTDPKSEKQSSHGAGFDPCVSIIPNYKTGDADQNASNSQVSVNDLQNETQKLQIPDLLSNTEANKSTKAIAEEKTTSSTAIVLSIIKDKQYVLFLISVSIVAGTVHATITILPDFAVSKGLTLTEAANVFSIGASGDIIARLISSLLLYKLKVPSLLIYTIAGILLTVLTVIYPFLAELSLISLLSFFVMLTCGVLFGVYNVIVLDFFDIEKFPIAMGMSETVSGCGIMLVGFLVGHVTEINDGDYTNTYFLLVGLNTVAMLPMIYLYMERIYLYMNKCRRK